MYVEKIKLYEDREDVTLTTYIQDDADKLLNGNRRPAVLICPGGGYMKCATTEAEPVALRFAAMGYHTFVLRYSTYFSLDPDEQFPGSKEEIQLKNHCIYPTPMREIGKAMLIIRELAEEWLIDVDRIVLCGFSAGAHNVAMYAENWDKPVIVDHFQKDASMFKPMAMILGYLAGDYYFYEEPEDKDRDLFFKVSYTAIAGKQVLSEEDKLFFSPSKHVTGSVPPAFLWATSTDHTVSVTNTLVMAQALATQGIPFECHIFEEGHHGLALATQESAKVTQQIRPDVAKWVELADTWLLRRCGLNLPTGV